MKDYNLEGLGLSSWLELYHQLEKDDLLGEKSILLNYPDGCHKTVDISVCTIKAKCFDELYQRLPLKMSITVIQDLLVDEDRDQSADLRVMQFLNKIPTRAK